VPDPAVQSKQAFNRQKDRPLETNKGSVIVATSAPSSLKRVQNNISGGSFRWVYLGSNIEEFQRVSQTLGAQGSYLDTTELFHEAAKGLREPYLDLIYDMGRDMNSLRWWVTSLSYRSPSTSNTFRHACYLRVALDLIENWSDTEPLVILSPVPVIRALEANLGPVNHRVVFVERASSSLMHRSVKKLVDSLDMLGHRAYFTVGEGFRILRARTAIRHPFHPSQPITVLASWATPDSLNRGAEFYKSYFGNLVKYLQDTGRQVAVAPVFVNEIPYKDALAAMRSGSTVPWLVLHRILTFTDLVRVVVKSLAPPPRPPRIPELAGMVIETLAIDDLRRHWISNGAPDAFLIAAMVRRMGRSKFPLERIIYTYENQPWERAMCWEARRELLDTKLVGYQHARASKLLLNWHLASGGEPEAPLPDHIVTVGQLTADLLSHGGYTPGQLRVGGALNAENRLPTSPPAPSLSDGPQEKVVLIAASYSSEETAELATVAGLLYGPDDGVQVILKCHPGTPLERIRQFARIDLPAHVTVSSEPIESLMLRSSVMVYSGSTVCIEALAAGLPVIHLRPRFDFDLDPLDSVPETRLTATGVEELRNAVDWLLNHRREYISEHKYEWERVSTAMYGQVNEETIRAFTE